MSVKKTIGWPIDRFFLEGIFDVGGDWANSKRKIVEHDKVLNFKLDFLTFLFFSFFLRKTPHAYPPIRRQNAHSKLWWERTYRGSQFQVLKKAFVTCTHTHTRLHTHALSLSLFITLSLSLSLSLFYTHARTPPLRSSDHQVLQRLSNVRNGEKLENERKVNDEHKIGTLKTLQNLFHFNVGCKINRLFSFNGQFANSKTGD